MSKVRSEVLEIVSTILEKEPDEIKPDAHLMNDLGADSMMALEILASLEKKFRIMIPEDKLKDLTSLDNIVALVETAKRR